MRKEENRLTKSIEVFDIKKFEIGTALRFKTYHCGAVWRDAIIVKRDYHSIKVLCYDNDTSKDMLIDLTIDNYNQKNIQIELYKDLIEKDEDNNN